jgi:hypothetical protein
MAQNNGIFLQFEKTPKTVQVSTAKSDPSYLQQDLTVRGNWTVNFTNFGFTGFG